MRKGEKLLQEAKERFLPGTIYHVAHLDRNNHIGKIVNPNDFHYSVNNDNIVERHRVTSVGYSCCIYYRGKWAEIVESEQKFKFFI